jgi:hypothetical protein
MKLDQKLFMAGDRIQKVAGHDGAQLTSLKLDHQDSGNLHNASSCQCCGQGSSISNGSLEAGKQCCLWRYSR